MKGLGTCLWLDGQAEEAARFYAGVFKDAKLGMISRTTAAAAQASGRPEGSVLVVKIELAGHEFMLLNGGPQWKFSPAVSIVVNCDTQAEIDHYWGRLGEGGDPKAQQCGWLADKFGLSWQIVPSMLGELIGGEAARAARVMEQLLRMKKLDLEALRNA